MKIRWSDPNYSIKTKTAIRKSFHLRWSNPIIRKRIIKFLCSSFGTSKLEKRVAAIAANFNFKNSIVIGRYLVDLLNENSKIIVEVNGDLWHCNPKFWKANDIHPNKKKTAKDIWEKDFNRKSFLESLGYKAYVLWEDDILKGKDDFIREFFKNINDYEKT